MLLIAISCAWVLGIFLGSIYHLPALWSLTGLLPIIYIFFFKQQRNQAILAAVILVTLFLAVSYYPIGVSRDGSLATYHNQGTLEIRGVVSNQPEIHDNTTHLELSLQEITTDSDSYPVQGKVLVYVSRYPEYRYGDVLHLKGKLESPPQLEGFDYQAYLERKGISAIMRFPAAELRQRDAGIKPLEWIYTLRTELSQVLAKVLPEPQSALAQGIVLGMRSTIPDTLKTALSVTGTAHLLAISGINLSIIAGILITAGLWIFGRRYYIYVWLALLIIWFYVVITGVQPPVIRSAIMASIFLLAELLGRQKNAFVALAFSAAVMVGITPQILWDVSFQLSFLSMIGLIIVTPSLQNLLRKVVRSGIGEDGLRVRTAVFVSDSFAVTCGALLAVWPIIALYFGIISFIGPLATLLIAPALPAIIVLGTITTAIGLLSLAAAQVIGWSAWLFLSYMVRLANAFASLPMAAINVAQLNQAVIPTYYAIAGLAVIYYGNRKKINHLLPQILNNLKIAGPKLTRIAVRLSWKWTAVILLIPAFLTSYAAVTLPDGNLGVSFLDVGEGDACLIQIGNRNILIDGGPSPQAVCLGLSDKMPFWNRSLDLIILTHPHLDHLNGLVEVLKRYRVKQILAPDLKSSSPVYQEWLNLIEQQKILYQIALPGQQLRLGDKVLIEILDSAAPPEKNPLTDIENSGIVARLSSNKISFLFTADINEEEEFKLINQRAELACTVLKVAHHAAATSTSSDFLAMARPRVAVISTGRDNPFGHPTREVLERLKNTVIYRTDQSGTVEFTTDGQHLWVKTEK